jgi:uracil-DNA glycosylase family 4
MEASKHKTFEILCDAGRYCTRCERMHGSQRILSRSVGPLSSPLMFIGEAPGRLGADVSGVPFYGDKAGDNFQALLDHAGIDRASVFITNAVLCNPRDDEGRNATPTRVEISNCSGFLLRQIELVDPRIVVTLGAAALDSLSLIEKHEYTLSTSVRTACQWFGRTLIPLYHPGQRAMVHRSFANQRSDYQFVAERLRRLEKGRKKASGAPSKSASELAREIIELRPGVSYFALHKLLFLAEVESLKRRGERLSAALFLRQKDGPYCVDLEVTRLSKGIPDLEIIRSGGRLHFRVKAASGSLFREPTPDHASTAAKAIITGIIQQYGNLDDARLKTRAYLAEPMRKILREEQTSLVNLFNTPIKLDSSTVERMQG